MILAAPAKPGTLVEKYHLLKRFLMRDAGWARNDEPRGKQQQPSKPEGQRRKHTTDHPALQTICTTTSVSLRDAGGVLVRVPSTQTLPSFRKDKQRAHQGIQHPSTFGHPGPSSQGHATLLQMEPTALRSAKIAHRPCCEPAPELRLTLR